MNKAFWDDATKRAKKVIEFSLMVSLNDDEKILLADGFEAAFVGIGRIFNQPHAVYDRDMCIQILVQRDGMTEEEAQEWMSYNVEGGYVGESTPMFFDQAAKEESPLG